MKHTIKGIHGHLYKLNKSAEVDKCTWTKVCISAKDAFKNDYLVEEMNLRQVLSKKYKVCWACNEPTNKVGGYSNPNCTKILFYECEKCYPSSKEKKSKT